MVEILAQDCLIILLWSCLRAQLIARQPFGQICSMGFQATRWTWDSMPPSTMFWIRLSLIMLTSLLTKLALSTQNKSTPPTRTRAKMLIPTQIMIPCNTHKSFPLLLFLTKRATWIIWASRRMRMVVPTTSPIYSCIPEITQWTACNIIISLPSYGPFSRASSCSSSAFSSLVELSTIQVKPTTTGTVVLAQFSSWLPVIISKFW